MIAFFLALSLMLQAPPAAARGGVVTGTLLTVDGKPAGEVRVSALQAPPANVRPEDGIQYYLAPPPIRTVMTDKEGHYRLTGLPPGRYFIAAGIPGQDTYYPDAGDGYGATVLEIAADSNITIDFRLIAPLAGRISGRVVPPPEPGAEEKAILSGVYLTELVETPVHPDGTFEFGRVPSGTYLVDLYPTVPGMISKLFDVAESDVNNLELVRPKLHTITGRIKVAHGPLPWSLLAFYTDTSYAAATINDDGTFTVRLQSAKHFTDLAGMPSDYDLISVKRGNEDVTKGLVVGDQDVSGVVINVTVPDNLPAVRGQVLGVPAGQYKSLRIEMTGPIVGVLTAAVASDGTFRFPEVPPGGYYLKIPQLPQLNTVYVAVDWNGADVKVTVPAR